MVISDPMKIRLSKRGVWLLALVIIACIMGPLRGVISNTPGVGVPFLYIYYWTDSLKFWGTKSLSPSLRGLEIPTVAGRPIGTAPVGSHFRSPNSSFVLTSNPTPIYTRPSQSSRRIRMIQPGYRVRVVYQKDDVSVSDSNGRGLWVFLTMEDGKRPIGWAINTTLGYQDKFAPPAHWNIPYFSLCIGEYCASFKVKPSGRFYETWDSIGKGIEMRGKNTGQIFEYQSLIWAKQDDPEDYDELIIKDKAKGIRHEDKYRDEPIKVTRSYIKSIRSSRDYVLKN